jgi:hypothetical protein
VARNSLCLRDAYGSAHVDPRYADCPILPKPVLPADLELLLEELTRSPEPAPASPAATGLRLRVLVEHGASEQGILPPETALGLASPQSLGRSGPSRMYLMEAICVAMSRLLRGPT